MANVDGFSKLLTMIQKFYQIWVYSHNYSTEGDAMDEGGKWMNCPYPHANL